MKTLQKNPYLINCFIPLGIIPISTILNSTMAKSPFKYGSTVSNKVFTNRQKENKKLFLNLTSGINTTIISPQRWGKSSLVEKVFNKINRSSKNYKFEFSDRAFEIWFSKNLIVIIQT